MGKRRSEPAGYVVCWTEHLRDGQEYGAKVVPTRQAAEALLEKIANGFAGDNCTLRLFELGPELPMLEEVVEDQEVKVTRRRKFRV